MTIDLLLFKEGGVIFKLYNITKEKEKRTAFKVTFASAAFSLLRRADSAKSSTIAFNFVNLSTGSMSSILSIKLIAAFAVAAVESVFIFIFTLF
jgi:hypothetical protein